jgi:hypothetical protein
VNWLACENDGTPACNRQDLAFGQFILAMIGLVPALLLVVAVAVRKRWAATVGVAVGVPLYLAGPSSSMLPSTDGMTST